MDCPYCGAKGSVTAESGLFGTVNSLCGACGLKWNATVKAGRDQLLREEAERQRKKKEKKKGFFSF